MTKSPSNETSWVRATPAPAAPASAPAAVDPKTSTDSTGKYQGPTANTYSGGCANNCADFATLAQAIAACDAIPTQCFAITYSSKNSGGSSSKGAFDGVNGF